MIEINGKLFNEFLSQADVENIVSAMASKINEHYQNTELTVLVVLNGAIVFAADLMRKLDMPTQVETVRASSYRNAMVSSGTVELSGELPSVKDKHVLIVEDIIDTGNTITALRNVLDSAGAASVAVASFLSKPSVHQNSVNINFVGLELGPEFVVGYGLDYAGLGRNLPGVWIVNETVDL